MENQLLTTKEAAEKLGVTDARVRAMILAGRLPAQSFGRAHMINEADLALVSDRKAGRPKKEPELEIAPGGKKWPAEQQTLPAVPPTKKTPAKRTPAPKTKAVATKKAKR